MPTPTTTFDISNLRGLRVSNRYWTDRENWNEGGSFSYGHADQDKAGEWIVPGLTSGSDYSGSLVERANFNVLLDEANKIAKENPDAPAFHFTLYGGHGTYALAFHIDRTPDELKERLCDLEEYPLADEDEHSQLEMDAQDEAWENWARADFRALLRARFDEDVVDALDDEKLFSIFRDACDVSNEYWENESGGDMWIDLERIAEKASI